MDHPSLMKPDLDETMRLNYQSVARRCARGVRGCATDDQYCELIDGIVEALAFAAGHIKNVNA